MGRREGVVVVVVGGRGDGDEWFCWGFEGCMFDGWILGVDTCVAFCVRVLR